MPKKKKKIPKPLLYVAILALSFLGGFLGHKELQQSPPLPIGDQDQINCYFSPNGGCTQAIVTQIRRAQTSIYVFAFAFTSKAIADALIDAKNRGVEVKILADREQSRNKYSKISLLKDHGIPVWIDRGAGYAHNKIIIIDDTFLFTGSFNFSENAEKRNRENLLFIRHALLILRYKAYWDQRMAKATRYQ